MWRSETTASVIQRLRFALASLGAGLLCGLAAPACAGDALPAASFTIEIATGSPNPQRFPPAPVEQPHAAAEAEAPTPDAEGFEPEAQVQLDVRFVAVDGPHAIDLADGHQRAALVRAAAPASSSEPIATSVRVRRVADPALDARLSNLRGDGDLRVLARTTLLTASGATAEFDSGGIAPVADPDGHGVGFRAYGARLVLQPRVGADGAIHLAIRGELTGDGQDAAAPRQVMAAERLRHGETLLVAHLFDNVPAGPRSEPGWFARTPIGKALIKPRPPPVQTQLALIVTARLPADSNPDRVLATLTAEDLEAPAMPKARGPPLRGALAQLAHRVRAALSPPVTRARAGLTWSARLMVRASRAIARA